MKIKAFTAFAFMAMAACGSEPEERSVEVSSVPPPAAPENGVDGSCHKRLSNAQGQLDMTAIMQNLPAIYRCSQEQSQYSLEQQYLEAVLKSASCDELKERMPDASNLSLNQCYNPDPARYKFP